MLERTKKTSDAVLIANAENNLKDCRIEKDALEIFKKDLGTYVRFYEFMSQIVDYDNREPNTDVGEGPSFEPLQFAVNFHLTHAAMQAGFSDAAHFNRCFRDSLGVNQSLVFRNIDRFEV